MKTTIQDNNYEYPQVEVNSDCISVSLANTPSTREQYHIEKYGMEQYEAEKSRQASDKGNKPSTADDIQAEYLAQKLKEIERKIEHRDKQNIKAQQQTAIHSIYDNSNGSKPSILIGIIAVCMLCAVLIGGVVLSSAYISKQITASSATSTEHLVGLLTKNLGKSPDNTLPANLSSVNPSDAIANDIDIPSDDVLSNCYMKALAEYPAAAQKELGATWNEILAFDGIIRHVVGETNNPVIKEVFSAAPDASMIDIANGYKIWSYIMNTDEKRSEKNKIGPGTALLEAASLVKYSRQYNVPVALAVGVTQTESAFKPSAVSHKKALGPMQVVYDIHYNLLKKEGIPERKDMFSADTGIKAGCLLLGRYLKDEKSVTGGLKRYYGDLSPAYINSVMSHRHAFELFAAGTARDIALTTDKEKENWKKMTESKQPVITSAAIKSNTSKTKTTASKTQTTSAPEVKQSMTVYKNTGSITITNPDGSVNRWKK